MLSEVVGRTAQRVGIAVAEMVGCRTEGNLGWCGLSGGDVEGTFADKAEDL